MKKLFLVLAFMLVGTSFAENTDYQSKVESMIESNRLIVASCTMTIKNNKTGDSYTITVHDMSCAELIKSIIKK